ncbi:hypothetical protein ACFWPU_12045 [Streptomyces sp. NPDC058471]|uniref:hypothetical protein n=1 Tax=Streptomyces sp. NPDC058471 TaxID=3346516 RepID=UPI0036480330
MNAAILKFQSALEHATPRGVMLYRIELLHSYARAKAWREAEEEIHEISPLLSTIASGRNRLLLRDALQVVERTSGVQPRAELTYAPSGDQHLELLPSVLVDMAAHKDAGCVVAAAVVPASDRSSAGNWGLDEGPQEDYGGQGDDRRRACCLIDPRGDE